MPKIFVIIMTLLSSSLVYAGEYLEPLTAPDLIFYAELSLNNNQFNDYDDFATGSDTGYRFLVGTTLGKDSPWAIEGFISKLGEVKRDVTEAPMPEIKCQSNYGTPIDVTSCSKAAHYKTSGGSIGGNLKYFVSLPTKTSLYLNAGIQIWDISLTNYPTLTANGNSGSNTTSLPNDSGSSHGVDPYFALGVTQHFMKRFAVSLEYADYQFGDNSIPSTSLGLRYQFN